MVWRLWIGSTFNSCINWVLSRPWFPLTRYIPVGFYWHYDLVRFMGSRGLQMAFDVGANAGQTLSGFVLYFPRAEIHAFEPVRSTFAALEASFGGRKGVVLNPFALGSQEETRVMSLHANSELNTLVASQPRTADLTGVSEEVRLSTLDHYCKGHGIRQIDLLKLDVQGWEMEVLRGGLGLLADRRIRFIYAEVGFRRDDTDMQHFSELNEFLESNGYRLSGFYDHFRWGTGKPFLGFSNALYINPAFESDPAPTQ